MNAIFRTRSKPALLLFLVPFFIHQCAGHDWPVHMRITGAAYGLSDSLQTFLNANLESQRLQANPPQVLGSGNLTPNEWLQWGSRMEDEQSYAHEEERTMDHFYTVVPDRTPGQVIGLTDGSEHPWWDFLNLLPGGLVNSFVWVEQLGVSGPLDVGPNLYKWVDARNHEYAALASQSQSDRNQHMALMLYTLGHVLHLNQDLSQPDHVRNDNHFSKRYIEDYGSAQSGANPQWFAAQLHNWLWWKEKGFVKLLDFWDRGIYVGDANSLNADTSGAFNYTKLGLAEYTSGNFLGEDALYNEMTLSDPKHHFPFPELENGTNLRDIQYKLVEGLSLDGAFDATFLKNGEMVNRIYLDKDFPGERVHHHSVMGYLGVKANPFAGAYGNYWNVQAALSINDPKVLQDYHDLLIPKAVEYSAGILDYFFRGKLEIASETPDTEGHSKIQIRNRSGQDFSGGAFHLFWDDASGTRTEIQSTDFTTTYETILTDGDTIEAEFVPPSGAVDYLVLYKGTIGSNGGTALDQVDADVAIAAARIPVDFEFVWVLSGDEGNLRGNDFGQSCPWPDDYLDQPNNWGDGNYTKEFLCNQNSLDPYRWPATEVNPVDSRSSASSAQVTLFTHSYSSDYDINDSSAEKIYLRKKIEGGATGKHVVMHGDWTFPGGEWVASAFDSDSFTWYDYNSNSYMDIDIGHVPEEFFYSALPVRDIFLYRDQENSESGVIDYAFDIPPGIIDYACVEFEAWTHDNGPATLRLTLTVTDN